MEDLDKHHMVMSGDTLPRNYVDCILGRKQLYIDAVKFKHHTEVFRNQGERPSSNPSLLEEVYSSPPTQHHIVSYVSVFGAEALVELDSFYLGGDCKLLMFVHSSPSLAQQVDSSRPIHYLNKGHVVLFGFTLTRKYVDDLVEHKPLCDAVIELRGNKNFFPGSNPCIMMLKLQVLLFHWQEKLIPGNQPSLTFT